MKPAESVSLAAHTTFKIGGPSRYFVEVSTKAELAEAIAWARTNGVPIFVLGGGSNVLVSDAGFPGLTIRLANTEQSILAETNTAVTVTVGAGVVFDDFVAEAVANGWWGLENLSHIPGSVGAAPIQNIGAYGVEVKDCIKSVEVFNQATQSFETLSAEACQFGYRDSLFKTPAGKQYIVWSVTFLLSPLPQPQLVYRDLAERFADSPNPTQFDIRSAIIAIRSQKFPDWTQVGTAGSFFKNPVIRSAHYQELLATYPELPSYPAGADTVKIPLGWILDKVCQLRGVRYGTVGTYAGQALVMINHGDATAADVTTFAEEIAAIVFAKTNITIEWEVTKIF